MTGDPQNGNSSQNGNSRRQPTATPSPASGNADAHPTHTKSASSSSACSSKHIQHSATSNSSNTNKNANFRLNAPQADAVSDGRAEEVEELLTAVTSHLIPFIRSASCTSTAQGSLVPSDSLHPPTLKSLLEPESALPDVGQGKEGLLKMLEKVLKYSVNTWSEGFLDKLYGSTNAPGVAAELILAVLNTNVHVYQVSPVLTLLEKTTSAHFASLFGFTGPFAGGITLPGGSYSNSTALIIARNTLYPSTKLHGNQSHKFTIYTSTHGHYSIEKAAIMCGLGSTSVRKIPVDEHGRMDVSILELTIDADKKGGFTPLFVNAGAGTTVLGSYDPFHEIEGVCRRTGTWFHVDGSWGGSVVFSERLRGKMNGCQGADSITVNPHKMLSVPVTCSFLLARDTRVFHRANTIEAGYLFHNEAMDGEVYDMADMTLGCGRKADSLKLALSWIYYGKQGYEKRINHAFDMASHFANIVSTKKNFVLVSSNPPPCLQVCFYYTPTGVLSNDPTVNTKITRTITNLLIREGFMVDYAPSVDAEGNKGDFFRAVVNAGTSRGTVERLVEAIERIGREVGRG